MGNTAEFYNVTENAVLQKHSGLTAMLDFTLPWTSNWKTDCIDDCKETFNEN